jgi:prevent-host-death family protein
VRVTVGKAQAELSELLARVAVGEDVEIVRDGVPVARLIPIERSTPGSRFLAARGRLADSITIVDDFELSAGETDAMLDDPA